MRNTQTTSVQGDQQSTPALADQDYRILDDVDRYLAAGVQLKQWWGQVDTTNAYTECFKLGLTFNRPDTSFGFFDYAAVDGRTLPVMGNLQDMLYDQPKAPSAQTADAIQWMQAQIREFVLHYFMRVSDFRQPQGFLENARPAPPPYLRPLSWCPQDDPRLVGFGFSQLFYKLRDTGHIGQFPEEERFAIIDLRELGQKYEWIVVKVRIFDFSFTYMPLGADNPQLVLPLSEASYLVLSRDFITNDEHPAPDILGQYGLGYVFIKNPTSGVLAYGPGQFDAAIELINFRVLTDGTTRVRMVFVANRPERILNLSLDPINWGFTLADLLSFGLTSPLLAPVQSVLARLPFQGGNVDPVYTFIWLVNVLTGGEAAQQLCISKAELDKQFLVKHFMQHYQTIVGTLQTWRQIPDWLDSAALPKWVITGVGL
jgi:hypothetical protein